MNDFHLEGSKSYLFVGHTRKIWRTLGTLKMAGTVFVNGER